MAIDHSLKKIAVPVSHLPSLFFILGYPLFWLQLFTHSAGEGVTSPWAWFLWIMAAAISINCSHTPVSGVKEGVIKGLFSRPLWSVCLVPALFIMTMIVLAGLKPIHLVQEFDCLQYHYTLPRQHLILGSFDHIRWAADDLFLLPVDFALAPFWFTTVLPNKIPQLVVVFCLIGVAARLASSLAGASRAWMPAFMAMVILGTHGLGIQMGTGMLDLTVAYLFLASLDSLRTGMWFLAGVEGTFFFWSKPAMPLAIAAVMVVWAVLFLAASSAKWQLSDVLAVKEPRKAFRVFLVLSTVVAGPFMAKSLDNAGTPFYPLFPGIASTEEIKTHPKAWESLQKSSHVWGDVNKNSYGHGRGLGSFIKHWWLLAVPEKGVNNAFDYPLGLTYLLMAGPFFFFIIKDISRRKFSCLGAAVLVMWGMWWFGPQQTRFLYVPLLIIFLVTASRLKEVSRVLLCCLLIALLFEAASLWGAHKRDLGRWGISDLRAEDKELTALSRQYLKNHVTGYIIWPSHDAAYAQFPVMVTKENLPHTVIF